MRILLAQCEGGCGCSLTLERAEDRLSRSLPVYCVACENAARAISAEIALRQAKANAERPHNSRGGFNRKWNGGFSSQAPKELLSCAAPSTAKAKRAASPRKRASRVRASAR